MDLQTAHPAVASFSLAKKIHGNLLPGFWNASCTLGLYLKVLALTSELQIGDISLLQQSNGKSRMLHEMKHLVKTM